QTRRIAPQSGAAGPRDPLARCRRALSREFLRGGRDVLAADRTALGGRRPGTHAPGHALDRGEDPQSQTLSRTPQIPAPAATVSCTAPERQSAAREAAAAGGADSCQ